MVGSLLLTKVLCCALLLSSALWLMTSMLYWGYLLRIWCKKLVRYFIDLRSRSLSWWFHSLDRCWMGAWQEGGGWSAQPGLTAEVRTLTALCMRWVWGRGGERWHRGRCALWKEESKVIPQYVTSEQRTPLRLGSALCRAPAVCSWV